jgi:hypothetical protein
MMDREELIRRHLLSRTTNAMRKKARKNGVEIRFHDPSAEENERLDILNMWFKMYDLPLKAYIPESDPITKGTYRLKKFTAGGTKRLYETMEQLEEAVHGILNNEELLEINRAGGRLVTAVDNS